MIDIKRGSWDQEVKYINFNYHQVMINLFYFSSNKFLRDSLIHKIQWNNAFYWNQSTSLIRYYCGCNLLCIYYSILIYFIPFNFLLILFFQVLIDFKKVFIQNYTFYLRFQEFIHFIFLFHHFHLFQINSIIKFCLMDLILLYYFYFKFCY